MEDHVRVRLKYVELVRAGRHEEAQEVLESIWDRKNIVSDSKPVVEKSVVHDTIIEEKKEVSLDDLVKIKGIGTKTVKDIKVMFNDIESLKEALNKNKVALRDDIVEKLKEELI